jgi:hypothetical protein
MLRHSKPGSRQAHQITHADGFRLRYPAALRSDPIIAATLVIKVRVGAVFGLFN